MSPSESEAMMAAPLVDVKGLKKHFVRKEGLFGRRVHVVQALDRVSLTIQRGQTLGVVGESGCGKTTLGRCILHLIPPTAGEVHIDGVEVTGMREEELRRYRRNMQMVFQNPYSSLDPRQSVHNLIAEPIITHTRLRGAALTARVLELLELVGLHEDQLYRYPHEFSGGQLQRIAVARSLALNPKFLVLDEPTSALDVSVQASLLNLLQTLQQDLDLTFLFISHDLSVVEYLSDEILVMYLGRVAERGSAGAIFQNPKHPYTQALLSATPSVDPEQAGEPIQLPGDVPSPADPPSGCYFHTRCPVASATCSEREPALTDLGDGHQAACFLLEG
jgi:oligopeptide/dipeptide ABC transporter ATP-binding protein